jgi:hypothetical protein
MITHSFARIYSKNECVINGGLSRRRAFAFLRETTPHLRQGCACTSDARAAASAISSYDVMITDDFWPLGAVAEWGLAENDLHSKDG